jgi:hypothetical protein
MGLTLFMLGVFAGVGCGPQNEENLKGPTPIAPEKPEAANVTGYADAVKYMEGEQKTKAAEAKRAAKNKP